MARPVPPQVIPRPPEWQPGGPPPWADVAAPERTRISLERVVDALASLGQAGALSGQLLFPDEVRGGAALDAGSSEPRVRLVNAGVLAILFEESGETRLVLTRRSTAMRTHRGEVSFPGGRLNEGEDPLSAAVREANEEVGLDPSLVTVVGWLHPVMTMVSASLIVPVIATVSARPVLIPNPTEVERVFDVALAELADPSIFHEERWRIAGRRIAGSEDDSFPVWFFEIAGEMIWGATARMIHELISLVLTGRNGDEAPGAR